MNVNSSSVSSSQDSSKPAKSGPNYAKAALYIAIATIAAIAFAALAISIGGSIILAAFMFSVGGLIADGLVILAGTVALAIFASFMCYETCRCSKLANKYLSMHISSSGI